MLPRYALVADIAVRELKAAAPGPPCRTSSGMPGAFAPLMRYQTRPPGTAIMPCVTAALCIADMRSAQSDGGAGIGSPKEQKVSQAGAGGQAGLAACCATGDAVEVRIVEAPGAGSGEGDLHRRSAGLH